ncbi:ankyrin repeat domain-containing protein [Planctomicrobium sp.]|nr:M56 family metallopeptidase [Planctomicrobium sp.]MDB4732887.1 ankyrin repeat domain-containing protein [Planctomicrobium sp.]
MVELTLFDANFCTQLCQTLLYSLWQVAVLSLVVWIIERLLARRFPEAAYVCSCGMLLIGLILLPVTFHALSPTVGVETETTTNSEITPVVEIRPANVPLDPTSETELAVVPAKVSSTNHTEAVELHVHQPAEFTQHTSTPLAAFDWSRLTPWAVGVYLIGVMWMLLRLVNSIRHATRLTKQGEVVTTGPLHETLQKLAKQWSMTVLPRLAVAKKCVMPKVIGVMKPTILLPANALTGLSEEELEIILLHELAHVRRHDLWMNLVQRLAEVVLFYNPALWWLSHRISTLREYCCDEMACRTMSQMHSDNTSVPRTRYAMTLLRIVEMMQGQPANESLTTLALSNRAPSELRRRVGRLFGESIHQPVSPSRGGIVFVVVGIMLMMCTALWTTKVDSADTINQNQNAELIKQLEQECSQVSERHMSHSENQSPVGLELFKATNQVFTTLPKIKGLEELQFEATDLREMDFGEIGNLTSLKKLSIMNCQFLPHQMNAFQTLRNLEELDVMFTVFEESQDWRNQQLGKLSDAEKQQAETLRTEFDQGEHVIQAALLTDRAMPYLKDLHKLRSLKLINTFVSPNGFAHLKNSSELETLSIGLSGATSEAVQPLLGMKKLKSLSRFDIDDDVVEQLAKIKSLEDLDVWAGEVTDAGAAHLATLTNLKVLDVNGIQISHVGLLELAKLPKLEELSMKHGAFSENAYGKFQQAYPNVKLPSRITWGKVELKQKLVKNSKVTIGNTTFTGTIVDEEGEPITVEGLMGYDCRMSSSRGASGNAGQFKGEFSVELPAGEVTLLNEVPGYAPTPLGPFTTKNGETVRDLKFVMTRGIDQRIKVADSDGKAISGATVISHPEFFGKTDGSVYEKTTDDKGEYLYEHLAKTRYAFNVTAPGFEPLRSKPLDLKLGEALTLTMIRSQPTTGLVLNPDGVPAANAKLRAQWEDGDRTVRFSDSDRGSWWGKVFATTNERGEFTLDQLTTGSEYMFIIQTEDGNRLMDRSLKAGQKNVIIKMPKRADLRITVTGDTSSLKNSRGEYTINMRQRAKTKTADGGTHGDLFGQAIELTPTKTGATALFQGLAIDPENDDQKVEVYTSFTNNQIVQINKTGDTEVLFEIPKKVVAPVEKAETNREKLEQLYVEHKQNEPLLASQGKKVAEIGLGLRGTKPVTLFLDRRPLELAPPGMNSLHERFTNIGYRPDDTVIKIQAHHESKYETVVAILDELKEQKWTEISFQAHDPSQPADNELFDYQSLFGVWQPTVIEVSGTHSANRTDLKQFWIFGHETATVIFGDGTRESFNFKVVPQDGKLLLDLKWTSGKSRAGYPAIGLIEIDKKTMKLGFQINGTERHKELTLEAITGKSRGAQYVELKRISTKLPPAEKLKGTWVGEQGGMIIDWLQIHDNGRMSWNLSTKKAGIGVDFYDVQRDETRGFLVLNSPFAIHGALSVLSNGIGDDLILDILPTLEHPENYQYRAVHGLVLKKANIDTVLNVNSLNKLILDAIRDGDLKTVQQLEKHSKFSQMTINSMRNQVLYHGHLEIVEYTQTHWKYDFSDLQLAAIRGDAATVDDLLNGFDEKTLKQELNKEAALEKYAQISNSPLTLAVRKGHTEIVRRLIDAGANVNESARYTLTPLCNAAERGHVKIMQLLLNAGAEIEAAPDFYTALCRACIGRQDDSVRLLLEAGADPNSMSHQNSRKPLFHAIDHAEIVKLLIEHDADINAKNSFNKTPLEVARERKQVDVIKLLLAAKESK